MIHHVCVSRSSSHLRLRGSSVFTQHDTTGRREIHSRNHKQYAASLPDNLVSANVCPCHDSSKLFLSTANMLQPCMHVIPADPNTHAHGFTQHTITKWWWCDFVPASRIIRAERCCMALKQGEQTSRSTAGNMPVCACQCTNMVTDDQNRPMGAHIYRLFAGS